MIRSQSELIERLIDYLKRKGGECSAVEVCRDVLGLVNCDETMAGSLVATGLPGDDRIIIDGGNQVLLRANKPRNPGVRSLRSVVIDIETTGMPAPEHKITEFAAVLLDGLEVVGEYQTLVNPEVRIPPFIVEMTGITDEMVSQAPLFSEIAGDIVDLIDDRVIVAHNSQFDVGFLNAELERTLAVNLDNPSLCTVRLARKLLPGLDGYRLGSVTDYLGIEVKDRHRAFGDAEATAKLFVKLLKIAEDKGWNNWLQLNTIAGGRKAEQSEQSN